MESEARINWDHVSPASPGRLNPRVVVKFNDEVWWLPYEDHIEYYLDQKIWRELVEICPGVTFMRLFTVVNAQKLQQLVSQAKALDPAYAPANLLTYFVLVGSPGTPPTTLEKLAEALSAWRIVQFAYVKPGDMLPGEDLTGNPAYVPYPQAYLDPAPAGIDARFAWSVAQGGDGTATTVIDIEDGWDFAHEALPVDETSLLYGEINPIHRYHGTNVLGVLCARPNAAGIHGIAPKAHIKTVSYSSSNTNPRWATGKSNAIIVAIQHLRPGDVLLLEVQTALPGYAEAKMPVEALAPDFEVIRLATALGIVVVEAAGNSNQDLDKFPDDPHYLTLNPQSPYFRDSGAILVAGAHSAEPHTRADNSNYGSRIDCYAWGENVSTCGPAFDQSDELYNSSFAGTSSAAAIIAGAAVLVQSIAKAHKRGPFNPQELRAILSAPMDGTPSDPSTERIGSMPNLRAIIENVLKIPPDA